jgi:ElaB/YqjD/DUF883 family membrane-anchored ribosome-binding protein
MAGEKSLSELETEAEHTRADLVHTMDELHSRVSPQAIKEEVKAYARETGSDLIHTLERKARENPLQAVAVGAGLAYPAWRFLINIPAPILLVGAGLALSQFGSSSPPHANARPGMKSPEDESVTDRLKRGMAEVSSNVSDAVDGLKEKITGVAEEAKSALRSGADKVRSRAASAMNDATNSVRSATAETVTAASDSVSDAYRNSLETASEAADQLRDSFKETKDNLISTIESHPFLVGGIGLLIGAVVASALPVTQAEDRLFGDVSDDLKNRAGAMANEGVQVAKSAAQNVYEGAVSSAQKEGLSPDVVRQTIKDTANKLQDLTDQATEALKEPAQKTSSSPSPSFRPT